MNKAVITLMVLGLLAAIIVPMKTCQRQEKSAELGLKVSVIDQMKDEIYKYYGPELKGLCPSQRALVTSVEQDLRAARQYQWDKKINEGLAKINPTLPSLYEVFPRDKPPFLKWSEMPEEILEELRRP